MILPIQNISTAHCELWKCPGYRNPVIRTAVNRIPANHILVINNIKNPEITYILRYLLLVVHIKVLALNICFHTVVEYHGPLTVAFCLIQIHKRTLIKTSKDIAISNLRCRTHIKILLLINCQIVYFCFYRTLRHRCIRPVHINTLGINVIISLISKIISRGLNIKCHLIICIT